MNEDEKGKKKKKKKKSSERDAVKGPKISIILITNRAHLAIEKLSTT